MKTTRTQTQQQMKQPATHNSKLHKLKRKIINFSLYFLMIGSFIAMIDHPENFVLFTLSIILSNIFIGSDDVNNNMFDEDEYNGIRGFDGLIGDASADLRVRDRF